MPTIVYNNSDDNNNEDILIDVLIYANLINWITSLSIRIW